MYKFYNSIITNRHHYSSIGFYQKIKYNKETLYTPYINEKNINKFVQTLKIEFQNNYKNIPCDSFFQDVLLRYELEYILLDGNNVPKDEYNIIKEKLPEVELKKVYMYLQGNDHFDDNFYTFMEKFDKQYVGDCVYFMNSDILFDEDNIERLEKFLNFMLNIINDVNFVEVISIIKKTLRNCNNIYDKTEIGTLLERLLPNYNVYTVYDKIHNDLNNTHGKSVSSVGFDYLSYKLVGEMRKLVEILYEYDNDVVKKYAKNIKSKMIIKGHV